MQAKPTATHRGNRCEHQAVPGGLPEIRSQPRRQMRDRVVNEDACRKHKPDQHRQRAGQSWQAHRESRESLLPEAGDTCRCVMEAPFGARARARSASSANTNISITQAICAAPARLVAMQPGGRRWRRSACRTPKYCDGADIVQRLHQRERHAGGERRPRQRQRHRPECRRPRSRPSVRATSSTQTDCCRKLARAVTVDIRVEHGRQHEDGAA